MSLTDSLRELIRRNAETLTSDGREQAAELGRRIAVKCSDFPSQVAFLALLTAACDELEGTR